MKIGAYRIPNKAAITARTSSLTNSFIASIMPFVKPSLEDFAKALRILEMDSENISCVYCGGKHTEWDHLRPFVSKRSPTGYYTTIFNLVPACGKCNQSKGNSNWSVWLKANHGHRPDLARRIKILKRYEAAGNIRPINVGAVVGKENFEKYMGLCNEIIAKMKEAHEVSRKLNKVISEATGVHCSTRKKRTSPVSPKKSSKDYTKYRLNHSHERLGKSRLALEIVGMYVKDHPGITYRELKLVFPDSLQKLPTFNYDVFRKYSEANKLLSGQIRYFVNNPISLADEKIAVCTQWSKDNIMRLIQCAKKIGFVVQ